MTKHQKRIDELELLVDEKDEALINLKQECASYKQTIANYPVVKQEIEGQMDKLMKQHKAEVETLKQDHATAVARLEMENKKIQKSVATQVNNELASLGIPIAESPKDEMSSGQSDYSDVLATLNTLKGTERTEFYKKNEKRIEQAVHSLTQLNK